MTYERAYTEDALLDSGSMSSSILQRWNGDRTELGKTKFTGFLGTTKWGSIVKDNVQVDQVLFKDFQFRTDDHCVLGADALSFCKLELRPKDTPPFFSLSANQPISALPHALIPHPAKVPLMRVQLPSGREINAVWDTGAALTVFDQSLRKDFEHAIDTPFSVVFSDALNERAEQFQFILVPACPLRGCGYFTFIFKFLRLTYCRTALWRPSRHWQ